MTKNEFISKLEPYAVQLRMEGSPLFPSVRIAQSALETGWKIPYWNNLGGIKVGSGRPNAYWKGDVVNKGTWEVYDDQRVDVVAAFRAYDSIYDFYKDQDQLLHNVRYDRVRLSNTPNEQANMLYECGYATDPQYAIKIINIMNFYGLKQYDQKAVDRMEQIEELQKKLEVQEKELLRIKNKLNMPEIPEWAKDAVDAAVEAGIVDTPNGGSYDFYRVITVLHRNELI